MNIFTSTIHLGTPTGITANVPSLIKQTEKTDETLVDYYYVYFVRVFFALTFTMTLVFIFFSQPIVDFLVGDTGHVNSFILIIASAPFVVVYSIGDAFLRSYGKLTQIVIIAIVSSISSILLLYPLLKYFGMLGVSMYLFISGVFVLTIYIVLNFQKVKLIFQKNNSPKLHLKEQIIKTGIVSLFSSFLFIGSNIILRKFTIDNLGLVNNGIYQSVSSLSASSFLVVYSYIATYLLPKIAGSRTDAEIRNEIDVNFRFILLLMVPTTIAIFSYRFIVINLLFSSEFLPAGNLIQYQFLGDFFRGLSGLFGIWMVYRMKLKTIILFDLLMNIVLVSLPYLTLFNMDKISLQIIPISYMFALALHFILYFIYTKKVLKYEISNSTAKTVIFSVILLSSAFFAEFLGSTTQYIIAPFLIILFWHFAITIEERNKFTLLIKKNLSLAFSKFKKT